ncbi:MAG TPA: RsmB/NOP family class I SAM-dependent RNA methyltransferase [Verrucomicrobiae bacterium]|nr:RsmB/NOP family class I SAM-dependent RNA methyltransferase [Verrucomicrobiae bacterium]
MRLDTIGGREPRPLRHTHLRLAADALATIFGGEIPADGALRELYARHRSAGSRDRAQVSELVYGVLREIFPLRFSLGEMASALELCVAHALRNGTTPDAVPRLDGIDAGVIAQRLAAAPPPDAATRHNLPAWMWDKLCAQYGEEAGALADALNKPATVDLRANTLKGSREDAIEALAREGIVATPTSRAATGLRLSRREALQRSESFRDGRIEPQDEGSQLLAPFTRARAGEVVVDFCAGAGGKTLALGAQMRDRGELHAFDVSRQRLARLEPRLARSGLTCVRMQALRNERDPRLKALARKCDAVLVDAPCSASGTLRRNPELRLRTPDLAALVALQRTILEAAAGLVKLGGRLVYATCSVLREENEAVVEAFLASAQNFRLDEALTLLPQRDGTDGFYAARLLATSS